MIVTVPAVAGRVLQGDKTLQLTDAEALRLEASLDRGLVICDRLEDEAARATRRQRRDKHAGAIDPLAVTPMGVPPNRAQVSAEEWV